MPNVRFEDLPKDTNITGAETLIAFENGFNSSNARRFPIASIKTFVSPLSAYHINTAKFDNSSSNFYYQAYSHKTDPLKYLISKFNLLAGARTFYQGLDGNFNAAWNKRTTLLYNKIKSQLLP